jgi:hypothetical protein
VDGIDRDHFLDYSAKSKISSFLPNTIQLLRCDPPRWVSERGADTDRSPSDRLVGGLLESRTRIRGSMASRRPVDPLGRIAGSGGPEIFDLLAARKVVETRRLELLTLSLQRRRSAD